MRSQEWAKEQGRIVARADIVLFQDRPLHSGARQMATTAGAHSKTNVKRLAQPARRGGRSLSEFRRDPIFYPRIPPVE